MMDETQKAIRVLGPCGCNQAKLCHPTAVGSHSAVTSPWRCPQCGCTRTIEIVLKGASPGV